MGCIVMLGLKRRITPLPSRIRFQVGAYGFMASKLHKLGFGFDMVDGFSNGAEKAF